MKQTLMAAAAALVLALSAGPAAASQVQSVAGGYETSLTQTGILAPPGALLGSLDLHTSPDGLVSGWYRPNYNEQFIPVTGWLRDGKLWLYVGQRGDLTISADLQKDGSFVGTATEQAARLTPIGALAPVTYAFSATPHAGTPSTY